MRRGETAEPQGDGSPDLGAVLQLVCSHAGPIGAAGGSHLMAYLNLIVRASQDYEGLGWVLYDSAFRRQAALTGNKKWSVINSTMYAMNFSARKVGTRRCELCFAMSHAEQDCAQWGSADSGMSDRLRYLESAVIAMVRPGAGKPTGGTYQCQAAGEEV